MFCFQNSRINWVVLIEFNVYQKYNLGFNFYILSACVESIINTENKRNLLAKHLPIVLFNKTYFCLLSDIFDRMGIPVVDVFNKMRCCNMSNGIYKTFFVLKACVTFFMDKITFFFR